MKLWITSLLITLTFNVYGNERVLKHQHATKVFRQLNFFQNGKGMHLTPDIIRLYSGMQTLSGASEKEMFRSQSSPFTSRWGANVIDHQMVGLFSEPYENMQVGVLGCVFCHSGKAAGRFYIGLGNKNVDVGQIAKDAYWIQRIWNWGSQIRPKSNAYKEVEQSAVEFAQRLSDDRFNNMVQGLVPTSMIRWWFYHQNGEEMPADTPRGAVKVAHLWGYGEKRKVGQFSDGYGDGDLPGWAIAVELAGGQEAANVREYLPKVIEAEDLLGDFLPPKYPFEIDSEKALKGKEIFAQTCQGCHGSYEKDESGQPIYQSPKRIEHEKVKTDFDRLMGNTEYFNELVRTSPLNDIIATKNIEPGYFAPRLEGIWARFPYLHNGSVPTIMDLLNHPMMRPKLFDLRDAGEEYRFDKQNLGLKKREGRLREFIYQQLARRGVRWLYDVTNTGQSNGGHYFKKFSSLNRDDKLAIIEYLKTL